MCIRNIVGCCFIFLILLNGCSRHRGDLLEYPAQELKKDVLVIFKPSPWKSRQLKTLAQEMSQYHVEFFTDNWKNASRYNAGDYGVVLLMSYLNTHKNDEPFTAQAIDFLKQNEEGKT